MRTYRLGGVSPRPWMTPRRAVAIVGLGVCVVVVVGWVARSGNPWGLVAVAAGVGGIYLTARQRTSYGTLWVADVATWVRRAVARRAGWDTWDPSMSAQPFWLRGARVLGVSAQPGGGEVGLLEHHGAFTAVIEVDGDGDGLRPPAEHARIEDGFRTLLAALAQPGVPVSQVDWVTRVVPTPGHDYAQWLRDRLVGGLPPDVVASMDELTREAERLAEHHTTYLVVRMPTRRLAQEARAQEVTFDDDTVAQTALATIGRVVRLLADHGIRVVRALSPDEAAALVRSMLAPSFQATDLDGIDDYWQAWPPFEPSRDGRAVVSRGPAGDEWWHTTCSIPMAGWPAAPVPGRWLAPVVFNADVLYRTVVVSFRLLPPHQARGLADSQLTTAAGRRDRELRRGQVTSGESERAEGAAQTIAHDIAVRGEAGVVPTVRVLLTAATGQQLGRDRESIEAVATGPMGCQRLQWHDRRHTPALLHTLPLGLEVPA